MMIIPFNQTYRSCNEIKYMQDCLQQNSLAGNGNYTHKAQNHLQEKLNCPRAFLTTSGTSALEMAALLINLKPGDEVILPSFTFVSTANAVVLRGAKPVFADICPDTLNLDPEEVEKKITAHTRAIMPVHYAGIACEMKQFMHLAREHNLFVIEDAAQAIDAKYGQHCLGTLGDLGCISFHSTKNISCGEGGALLINTSNPDLLERAELIWEKGTDRSRFLRGQVDKYTWQTEGSSFLPADILAALLCAQLEELDTITAKRKRVFDHYYDHLLPYQDAGRIRIPSIPQDCQPNYHIFYLLCQDEEDRTQISSALRRKGIEATFHYIPLHSSPMGQKLGYYREDLPLTEDFSRRILRLPLYPDLKQSEVEYVVTCLKTVLDR